MITRFAPTPSGYLHLGNAVHLRLLGMMAEREGWLIRLRIDDLDSDRVRPEYVADILDMIAWLGIPISGEPRRQSDHREDYARARDLLRDQGAYVCACSRTAWSQHRGPGCPAGCTGLELQAGATTLRIDLGGEDVVLWRREGIPAYHLASVVDDDAMGITHILRGADLRESTQLQRLLSARLPGSGFAGIEVRHHALLTDSSGAKFSKSAGAQASPLPRTDEVREEIERLSRMVPVED